MTIALYIFDRENAKLGKTINSAKTNYIDTPNPNVLFSMSKKD